MRISVDTFRKEKGQTPSSVKGVHICCTHKKVFDGLEIETTAARKALLDLVLRSSVVVVVVRGPNPQGVRMSFVCASCETNTAIKKFTIYVWHYGYFLV